MSARDSRQGILLLLMFLLSACAPTPLAITTISVRNLTGSAIYPADLKLSRDGTPQIAYLSGGTTRELRFQPPDGPSETVYTLENPAQSGFSFSLALDPVDQPGIAYFDERDDDLIYTERRGGRWVTETVDAVGAVGYFVSLAYDRQGQPHISYFDQTNNDVKYATRIGQIWQIETIDAYGLPGFHIPAGFTQLALRCLPTPDDCATMQPVAIYLAYRYKPYDGELRVAYRTAQGWQIETVDADRGAGGYPSLILDAQGQPWVSYYRASTWDFAQGELRLAHHDGYRWQVETIEEGDYVGRGSAITLTGDGRPMIVYYAAAPDELRLAVWNPGWAISRLSSDGIPGSWVSLAHDGQNRLHLVSADMSTQVTRYMVFSLSE